MPRLRCIAAAGTVVLAFVGYTTGTGWTSLRNGSVFDSDYRLAPPTGSVLSEPATASLQTHWGAVIVPLKPAGCTGGSLTVKTSPGITFGPLTLTGYDASTSLAIAFTLDDETGSGSGWDLNATSTTFSAGAKTLPTTATTITAASGSAASGNCRLPTSAITYPVTLPAGATPPTAADLFDSAVNTGEGPTNVTLTAKVALPANAKAGDYSSTWTLSLSSGP